MNRSWIYVFITSLLELVWLYGFKEASLWWHWVLIIAMVVCDLQLLAKACEGLPTGTVYAIFAATGTIGTVLMDYYLFDVTITSSMLVFMGIILFGVIGLNLSDTPRKTDDSLERDPFNDENSVTASKTLLTENTHHKGAH